jgi:hypothetical protein
MLGTFQVYSTVINLDLQLDIGTSLDRDFCWPLEHFSVNLRGESFTGGLHTSLPVHVYKLSRCCVRFRRFHHSNPTYEPARHTSGPGKHVQCASTVRPFSPVGISALPWRAYTGIRGGLSLSLSLGRPYDGKPCIPAEYPAVRGHPAAGSYRDAIYSYAVDQLCWFCTEGMQPSDEVLRKWDADFWDLVKPGSKDIARSPLGPLPYERRKKARGVLGHLHPEFDTVAEFGRATAFFMRHNPQRFQVRASLTVESANKALSEYRTKVVKNASPQAPAKTDAEEVRVQRAAEIGSQLRGETRYWTPGDKEYFAAVVNRALGVELRLPDVQVLMVREVVKHACRWLREGISLISVSSMWDSTVGEQQQLFEDPTLRDQTLQHEGLLIPKCLHLRAQMGVAEWAAFSNAVNEELARKNQQPLPQYSPMTTPIDISQFEGPFVLPPPSASESYDWMDFDPQATQAAPPPVGSQSRPIAVDELEWRTN